MATAREVPRRLSAASLAAARAPVARSQVQLAFRQLTRHRLAVISAVVLGILYLTAIFAPFVAPYALDFADRGKFWHPPVRIHFRDGAGFSLRPFVYDYQMADPAFRKYAEDTTKRYYIRLLARGEPYRLLWLIPTNIHLLGVDEPARIFLLGSDQFGRDYFSRLMFGGRVSLFIGILAISISIPIGLLVGGISGYYGGRVDNLLMRIAEVVIAFPAFYLLIALAGILPPTLPSTTRFFMIIAILSFIGWAGLARIIRGMVLSLKTQEFVLAAKALGASDLLIIVRHVLPNTVSFVIVVATLSIPGAILAESGLSFIGLGIQEPMSSWGRLLQPALSIPNLTQYPWVLIPGLFIFIGVLAYNLFGDGLRDALDPRLRTT